jgi:hypothetical protein
MVILINVGFIYGLRVAYNTIRFSCFPNLVQQWMVRRNHDYAVLKYIQGSDQFIQGQYGFSAMYSSYPSSMSLVPPGIIQPGLLPPSSTRFEIGHIPLKVTQNSPTMLRPPLNIPMG